MRQTRSEIRHYLLTAATDDQGKKIYLPVDKRDRNRKGDGSIWRVKIGNSAVDENEIVLMGGGSVVGAVPRGIPGFGIQAINMNILLKLLPDSGDYLSSRIHGSDIDRQGYGC